MVLWLSQWTRDSPLLRVINQAPIARAGFVPKLSGICSEQTKAGLGMGREGFDCLAIVQTQGLPNRTAGLMVIRPW